MRSYAIKINGKKLEVNDRHITGKEVLLLADLEPPQDYELLLKLTQKELEPVQLEEKVDLSNPGIENFHAKPYRKLTIYVDDEQVEVMECFMEPNAILAASGYDPEGFYLKQILGHKEITYKNDPHHIVAIRNKQRFSTCKLEPTTVS